MTATRRQIECLTNIYLGDRWDSHRVYRGHGLSSLYPSDNAIPDWGVEDRLGRRSNMGGATRRMRDGMGDAGLLVVEYSERGYRYVREIITSSGLRLLKAKYPGLPEIDQRLAERERVEAEEAAAAEERRLADRRQLEEQRERRRIERAGRMAAILQDYQISHALTPDQLCDMWLRVIDEEQAL